MAIDYYDERAAEFFQDTARVDMTALHERFSRYLPPRSRILDAGCGSGRDALAFTRAGFSVIAFDGSAEMVRLASASTRLPVLHLDFESVAWRRAFEGVWACASLLHVPRAHLPSVAGRLIHTLVPGGTIFMSFKLGETERKKDGRHFTDMTKDSLTILANELELDVVEIWTSKDIRRGREREAWVSIIGRLHPDMKSEPNSSC